MTSLAAIGAISGESVSAAKLPATYEAAKTALSACSRIDECQQWANKAEALAAYARMARDDSLRKMADRIQARAINRGGELLKAIPPANGANQNIREGAHPNDLDRIQTRIDAAKLAGMSEHQRKTALRVASVDPEEFERLVESDDPPTITALAAMGTQKKPEPLMDLKGKDPAQFKAATQAMGMLRDFAKFAGKTDPAYAAGGLLTALEISQAREHVHGIDAWLDRFVTSLE